MRVYLARHGRTVARVPDLGDGDRHLTVEGRREALRASERLAALGARPALVLTSPLVRAVQTAELLASGLPGCPEVRSHAALLPGAVPSEATDAIAEAGVEVLLVGHAPDTSRRAALLLDGPFPSFDKGMVVALDVDRDGSRGRFLFALLPAVDDVVESLADLRALL